MAVAIEKNGAATPHAEEAGFGLFTGFSRLFVESLRRALRKRIQERDSPPSAAEGLGTRVSALVTRLGPILISVEKALKNG